MKRVYVRGKLESFSTAEEQVDVKREPKLLRVNGLGSNKTNSADS